MENPIKDKSKLFALDIIQLYKTLCSNNEYVLSKQLLRSGTSIGANVREACRGQSEADFFSKMSIALKEADESLYWLELLYESGYITKDVFNALYGNCEELVKILVSITKNKNK